MRKSLSPIYVSIEVGVQWNEVVWTFFIFNKNEIGVVVGSPPCLDNLVFHTCPDDWETLDDLLGSRQI
jgi:hypothetical protein